MYYHNDDDNSNDTHNQQRIIVIMIRLLAGGVGSPTTAGSYVCQVRRPAATPSLPTKINYPYTKIA